MVHLPNEILELILLNLAISEHANHCDDEDVRNDAIARQSIPEIKEDRLRLTTLYNICLASKRFNNLAFSILHRTIDFDVIGIKSLPSILHSLCRRPDIRNLVRGVKLGPWFGSAGLIRARSLKSWTFKDYALTGIEAGSELDRLYQETLESLDLPTALRDCLHLELLVLSDDARLALVFALCTAIQRLSIYLRPDLLCDHIGSRGKCRFWCGNNLAYYSDHSYVVETIQATAAFRNIREFEIGGWKPMLYFPPPAFPLICEMPALKTLRFLNFLSWDRLLGDEFYRPKELLSKCSVELVDSNISASGLTLLLQALPALAELSIKRGRHHWLGEDLFNVICQHGKNLTSLNLDFCIDRCSYPETPLQMLTSLHSLVSLTVPVDALLFYESSYVSSWMSLIEGSQSPDQAQSIQRQVMSFARLLPSISLSSWISVIAGSPSVGQAQSSQRQITSFVRLLPTSLRFIRLLGLPRYSHGQLVDFQLVDCQLAELMRDPAFAHLMRIELLRSSSEPEEKRLGAERTSFAGGLTDSSWQVHEEIRREEGYEYDWEIFERVGQ